MTLKCEERNYGSAGNTRSVCQCRLINEEFWRQSQMGACAAVGWIVCQQKGGRVGGVIKKVQDSWNIRKMKMWEKVEGRDGQKVPLLAEISIVPRSLYCRYCCINVESEERDGLRYCLSIIYLYQVHQVPIIPVSQWRPLTWKWWQQRGHKVRWDRMRH